MRPSEGVTFDVVDGSGFEWTMLRLLALLARYVVPLRWKTTIIELSPSPRALRAESELEGPLDGPSLLSAFALDPQVVEGVLLGAENDGRIELEIRAIDGAHWDVYATDPAVLDALRSSVEGCQWLTR